MKRLVLILLSVACLAANAKPVSRAEARRVAQGMLPGSTLVDLTSQLPYTNLCLFVAEEGGYVLVSADDCAGPLLAWSADGTFRLKDMPAHVAAWLEGYDLEVKRLSMAGTRSPGWDADPEPPIATVAPLLNTTWDQGSPYNRQCPAPQYGSRPPAGCVAVATAQIMKYWSHPATGYGSHSYACEGFGTLEADFSATTYDWANMPNLLTSATATSQVNAVAQLIYHVGVAVEMEYATDANSGSSATSHSNGSHSLVCAENGLKYNFKYSPLLHTEHKADHTDSSWLALLRSELDALRPVYYTGRGGGGHAFVCDGYNTAGLFHMNWGWEGYCDGYYAIGALNPASGGTGGSTTSTYNLNNRVIVGIEPVADSLWGQGGTITATVGGNAGGSIANQGAHAFADTVQLLATTSGAARFAGWADGCRDNPRTVVVTGGDIALGARFTSLGGDTLSYCGQGRRLTSYGRGASNPEVCWGIRLPASLFADGRKIAAAQFYVDKPGTYDVTVFCGTATPTTVVCQQSATLADSLTDAWYTFQFDSTAAPDPNRSVWVIMHSTDIPYPASSTYCSGNQYAMLWGESYQPSSNWQKYSYMVRVITTTATEPAPNPQPDTTGIAAVADLPVGIGPNPANSQLTVEAPDGAELTLIDMNGRVVTHTTQRGNRTTLDVGHLPQGTYLLCASTPSAFGMRRVAIIH